MLTNAIRRNPVIMKSCLLLYSKCIGTVSKYSVNGNVELLRGSRKSLTLHTIHGRIERKSSENYHRLLLLH